MAIEIDTSIEIIYNIIKTKYEDHKNKSIEEIFTSNYINSLLDTYDNYKVIYCLKTLENIGINFNFEILENNEDISEEISEDITKEINKEDKLQINIARNDNEYRELVKKRFGKCIICQNKNCHISYCEVAHIYDFAKCVNDKDSKSKYDINNGLLMCANTHKMFDKHLLKLQIIDNNNALVSIQIDEILKDVPSIYRYNGEIITLFKENMKYIEKRYCNLKNTN